MYVCYDHKWLLGCRRMFDVRTELALFTKWSPLLYEGRQGHVSLKSPGLPVWLQCARRGWRPGACVGLQVFCASLGLTQPAATPGAAREAAATRHPPSSGRRLAPCDGRTSVQRRPPLTADTLGHLHYPELGTVEYKPSHIETCVGALRGNYSCPQCSLCAQFLKILLSVGSSKTWRKLFMAHIWHRVSWCINLGLPVRRAFGF